MAESFWGKTFELGTETVLLWTFPIALGNGAIDAMTGEGTFRDGAAEVLDAMDTVARKAGEFGDEHSELITRSVVSAVFSGLVRGGGGAIAKAIRSW